MRSEFLWLDSLLDGYYRLGSNQLFMQAKLQCQQMQGKV